MPCRAPLAPGELCGERARSGTDWRSSTGWGPVQLAILSCLSLTALLPNPVFAQGAAKDTAIGVAHDSRQSAELDTCLKSEDARNGIQSAMTDCYRDELNRRHALLNTTYRALRQRLSPTQFGILRASERQWIARTRKKCWGDPPRNGGTDGVQDSIFCLMLETKRRTDWLHSYPPR